MQLTRRGFAAGVALASLAACAAPVAQTLSPGLPNDLMPVPNSAYDAWVAQFMPRARSAGITDATLTRAFRGTGYLPGVVRRDRNQTEFKRTLEDYLSIAVSDTRVAQGRAALAREERTLTALEARYGVPAQIITAIWGLESFYGGRRGSVPVISATSTLAFDGRRGAFFERQLIAALQIVQSGDIPADRLTGSWAGAMGHTQFIPTSYQALAVDFDQDGRRDIWSDDPTDALASAANYLQRNGWTPGLSWGREVSEGTGGALLQPQPGGPRFQVTSNFGVIKRYNNSDAYAIGVGHLADRIAGAGPLRTPFPPDEFGMTKADRIALQEGLTARGFDTQGADGVVGQNTTDAISAYQSSERLAVTGKPSIALLNRLR